MLSGPLLGQTFIPAVWLSLVPIVAGCSMAAMKEISFSWSGFNFAMSSNVAFVLRNIYSTKYLKAFKVREQAWGPHPRSDRSRTEPGVIVAPAQEIDGINQYAWISIMAFIYEIPLAIFFEGAKWAPLWDAACLSLGGSAELIKVRAHPRMHGYPTHGIRAPRPLCSLQLILWGGLFYHLYNQASYMVLDTGVSAVSFSVGNTMKRVAVVVSSIMFFK